MFTLSSKNLERSTRNSTKGRPAYTGPLRASPCPRTTSLEVNASLSPTRDDDLPSKRNNNKREARAGNNTLETNFSKSATKVTQFDKLPDPPLPAQPSVVHVQPLTDKSLSKKSANAEGRLGDNINDPPAITSSALRAQRVRTPMVPQQTGLR